MFCFSHFCCFCFRNKVKLKHLHGIKCNDLSFTAMATELIPELGVSGLDSLLVCESCTKCLKEMYVFRKNCSRNIRLLMKYAEELCTFGGFSGNVNVQLVDIGKSRDGSLDTYGNDSTSCINAIDHGTQETDQLEIIEMENINIKSEPFYDDDPLRDNTESYHNFSSFYQATDPILIKNEVLEIKPDIYDEYSNWTEDNTESDIATDDNVPEAATLTPRNFQKDYKLTYERFMDWKNENRSDFSENVLLEYFARLTETLNFSGLQATFSMLKSTLFLKEKIDISHYSELVAFVERYGYERSNSDIENFVNEAPDEDSKMTYFPTYDENKKKRKHKTNKRWIFYQKFPNGKEAERFVKDENNWSYHYTNNTEEGTKRIYRCRKVRYQGIQCNSGVCLLYMNRTEEVVMFRSQLEHNCASIETKALNVIKEETKTKIKELHDSGLKPNAIMEHLVRNNFEVLNKGQVNNIIQKYKKEKSGQTTISLTELHVWLRNHSDVPESETDAYVVNFEVNETDETFRFFISSKELLKLALKSNIVHCDPAYKLIWQGCPVFVVGTSDRDKRFHVFGLSVTPDEQTADFTFLFKSVKIGVFNVFRKEFAPTYLLCDTTETIRSAFTETYGNCTIITCWEHVKHNVEKKLQRFIQNEHQTELLNDIETLQLSASADIFKNASKLLLEKWSKYTEFTDYFRNSWLGKNQTWFEGAAIGVPSTNKCLESWNRTVDHRTHRERAPLSRFLQYTCDWIRKWSLDYKNGLKPYANEPSISLNLWFTTYMWITNGKTIAKPETIDGYSIYKIPSKIEHTTDKNFDWKVFDDFKTSFDSYCITKIPSDEDWKRGCCDCPYFLRNYICKHIIGIAVFSGLVEVPEEAKNIRINQKPKRGRPAKVKQVL